MNENEVCRDYESTLHELKVNSKPHINMLTMLADENQRYASKIAQIIESRIEKVSPVQKLALLYLIDSIVKNCKKTSYKDCFARNLPNTFVHVFKNSDEKSRLSLYKLRNTWPSFFPASKLYALDIKVNEVDPKWPIRNEVSSNSSANDNKTTVSATQLKDAKFKEEMQQKELLLRLQQQKLELELKKAQESLIRQQKQLEQTHSQTLKRTSPSPTIIPPAVEPARIRSPGLLGDAPSSSCEVDCGVWLPMKKIKLENEFIDARPSVSGLNDRTTTPLTLLQTPTPSSTPIPPPTPLSTVVNKPPNLESVPVNNRIYVDGRGYEVRFIEDAAVIERNGLPHRIAFVGPAKDVVVDGIAHPLKFDETKTVLIDGQPHTIKFGAPSRELYLGKVPLRGAFGGPPIFININGTKHRIQLCGPPPEVKIDPEPAYELIRFMRSSHRTHGPVHDYSSSNQPPQRPSTTTTPAPSQFLPPPVQTQTAAAPIDIAGLLAKLAPIVAQPTKPPTPPVAATVRLHQVRRPSSNCRTSYDNDNNNTSLNGDNLYLWCFLKGGEVVRRAQHVHLNLKDFNPSLFTTRYSSVIDLLYKKTLQCSTCGLRFVDGDTQKYSKHLDWHFKQNRRDKTITKSNSRPWYFAAEDWVNVEEFCDDNATKSRSVVFDNQLRHGETENSLLSTDSVITANNDTQNFCSVCGDKFEQFWDEDDEAWKLRNATLVNGKAYHPLCYADAGNGEIESNPIGIDFENAQLWSNIVAGTSGNSSNAICNKEKPTVKTEPLDDYVSVHNGVVKTEPVDDYFM